MKPLALPLLVLVLCGSPASARILHVPLEYPTIQAAIDASAPAGDTVSVSSGAYEEDVTVSEKRIDLLSENGAGTTSVHSITWGGIYSPGGSVSGFHLIGTMVVTNVWSPFTLDTSEIEGTLNVFSDSDLRLQTSQFHSDVTLYCELGTSLDIYSCAFLPSSSLSTSRTSYTTIDHCTLSEANTSIYCDYSCVVRFNVLQGGNGLFLNAEGPITVYDNVIEYCDTGVYVERSYALVSIAENAIAHCASGIIYEAGHYFAHARIQENRIVACETGIFGAFEPVGNNDRIERNVISDCGSGIEAHGMFLTVRRNTMVRCAGVGVDWGVTDSDSLLANNVVACGTGVNVQAEAGDAVSCNNVWDCGANWLGMADPTGRNGNISSDPFFCNGAENEFALSADSPCLPGQHPNGWDCGVIGALGQGCDGPLGVREAAAGGGGPIRTENPYRIGERIVWVAAAEGPAEIAVYDVGGRRIRVLFRGWTGTGELVLSWNGRADGGQKVGRGVYFIVAKTVIGQARRTIILGG